MIQIRTFVFAVGLLFLPSLYGQEQPSLVSKRDLTVLGSPRNGLFCQHGKELGKLPKNSRIETYSIVKSFCGFVYPIEYIKFEYKTSSGEQVVAYVRRKETDGSERFSAETK